MDDIMCSWCGRLEDDKDEESTVVGRKRTALGRPIGLCAHCVTDAVAILHDERVNLARLYQLISNWPIVRSTVDRGLAQEVLDRFRDEYQREFLEARDPSIGQPDDGERVKFSVSLNRYTLKRVEALANEAGMSPSEWIRTAIFAAFDMTTHKKA